LTSTFAETASSASVEVVAHEERMSAVRPSVATVQVRSGVVRNMPD
jgi:hypothetical protein